jgi:DNA-binding transcriptional MerR regulator
VIDVEKYTSAQILDLLPTLSYRSLDYWIRTGLICPSIDLGEGSGYQRIFSAEDLELLRRIVRLHSVGVGLPVIRRSLEEHDSLDALLVELDAAMDEVRASA